MSNLQQVSDDTFEAEVLRASSPVLVDFWATWCGPCRMMAPVLENLAREVGGKLQVVKLDVDANPRTAGSFGIMGIPTMILFKDGKEADRLVGYMPLSTLRSKLSKTLDLN